MQPSNTTELQAVNTMLSTIGEAPVDSLSGATSSDAALADQVLTEVVRETLVQGWYFNIDKNYWLYRDGFGNIFLPANTARVEINRNKYPTIEPILRPQVGGTLQPGADSCN